MSSVTQDAELAAFVDECGRLSNLEECPFVQCLNELFRIKLVNVWENVEEIRTYT